MSQHKEACRALLESYIEVNKIGGLLCQPIKAFFKQNHQQAFDSFCFADCRKGRKSLMPMKVKHARLTVTHLSANQASIAELTLLAKESKGSIESPVTQL